MYPNILRHPGPTPIPKKVELAMNQDMISHRTEEFVKLYQETTHRVKPIFGTNQDILLLPSGGTASLEAAAVNTVSPGEGLSSSQSVLLVITSLGFVKKMDSTYISLKKIGGMHVRKKI